MVIDTLINFRKYAGNPRILKAFELLASPASDAWPDGRIELDGKLITAMPQKYTTRPADQCRYEAHRKYLDIQYIVRGCERMGWALLPTLYQTATYDSEKDVAFYSGDGNLLTVGSGMFTIFYPQDAHMPGVVHGEPGEVRKIVMKVALD